MTAIAFAGHSSRECGEHRTTGGRAWYFDCTEWCYPDAPCPRCELPPLREREERLRTAIDTACVLFEEAGRPHTAKALREIAYEDGER